MQSLERRPSGLTKQELAEHRARVFLGTRCVLGTTLVMPLWLLWKEYEAWGQASGFTPTARELRKLLDEAPWAEVEERPNARGRFKSIVKGVGMRSSNGT